MNIYVSVMAGGQSRRFDGDKTLEIFDGKPLIMHPVDRLKSVSDSICIVAKDCGKYAFSGVECVADIYDIQCPMVGILTALKHFDGAVFAVSADTPFVSPAHMLKLFDMLDDYHAVVPDIAGRQHPLYACYSQSIIPHLEKSVAAGSYSIMKLLVELDVKFPDEKFLFESKNDEKCFININTREDYYAANKYIGVN
jgi:molybdopterin-guanine dinucleotide biosynthesis protein A